MFVDNRKPEAAKNLEVISFIEAERKYDLNSFKFILTNQEDFKQHEKKIRECLTPLALISLFRGSGHSEHEIWMGNILISAMFDNPEDLSYAFACRDKLKNGKLVREHMTSGTRKKWWRIESIDPELKEIKVSFLLKILVE